MQRLLIFIILVLAALSLLGLNVTGIQGMLALGVVVFAASHWLFRGRGPKRNWLTLLGAVTLGPLLVLIAARFIFATLRYLPPRDGALLLLVILIALAVAGRSSWRRML